MWNIPTLKELMDERHVEMLRRLNELNGEAGRIRSIQEMSVHRSQWDESQRGLDSYKATVSKDLARIDAVLATTAGKSSGITSSMGVIISTITATAAIVGIVAYFVTKGA